MYLIAFSAVMGAIAAYAMYVFLTTFKPHFQVENDKLREELDKAGLLEVPERKNGILDVKYFLELVNFMANWVREENKDELAIMRK